MLMWAAGQTGKAWPVTLSTSGAPRGAMQSPASMKWPTTARWSCRWSWQASLDLMCSPGCWSRVLYTSITAYTTRASCLKLPRIKSSLWPSTCSAWQAMLCCMRPQRHWLKPSQNAQRCASAESTKIPQWIDKAAAERAKLRRWRTSQGWDEERIENAVQALKERQHAKEEEEFSSNKHLCEMGGVDFYFIRFFNHITQVCSEEQLLSLIHEGGLVNKLKGCMRQRTGFLGMAYGPHSADLTVQKLAQVWTNKARGLSRELFKRVEAEEAMSLELRQQGNTAFKEGRLEDALELYWEAAARNPQDHALFNNISLVALKLGDTHQAMRGAKEAVNIDPAVAKSWCRLGDAYRSMGRWQLAHLVYTCANELAPDDADIKARKDYARKHLTVVWDMADIPDPLTVGTNEQGMRWIGVSKQEVKKLARSMGPDADPVEVYEAMFHGRDHHSRVVACLQLKDNIDHARALAVATGMLTTAQLPPSCGKLKRPDQLPPLFERWSISWTDLPRRHKKTGLIRHQLTIMAASSGTTRATAVVLGTPGLAAVKCALLTAMTKPEWGKPGKPRDLFLAHGCFPYLTRFQRCAASLASLLWRRQQPKQSRAQQIMTQTGKGTTMLIGTLTKTTHPTC